MRIEEKFENVMLNIEMQVVSISDEAPNLHDASVDRVYNALLSKYKALLREREPREISLKAAEEKLYSLIAGACDFFTGDSEEYGEGHFLIELNAPKVSYENMVAILKHLRKSLRTWTKRGGSKGYIYYITQFMPGLSERN
jgi:hypothetical protein